jgi:L-threonylcarbamoyladenylate synthase
MIISKDIKAAAERLRANEVVAIPTETVYGLAANAFSSIAISKVYQVKERPQTNPLIVHIASIDLLDQVASSVSPNAQKLATHFWPGPLTLLLPKSPLISDQVTAQSTFVAVRVPNHPLSLSLLRELDFPLVAPSANLYTSVSPTTAAHVAVNLEARISFILDGGPCEKGLESTVVGFDAHDHPKIYRLGAITLEELQSVIDSTILFEASVKEHSPSPGMAKKHYAPRTPLRVVENLEHFLASRPLLDLQNPIGVLSFGHKLMTDKDISIYELSSQKNLKEASRRLYDGLYSLDTQEFGYIVVEWFENRDLGRTLNDKLKRASTEL